MDIESASFAAYLVAGLLFILALAGLSKHESAGLGNSFGIAGMVVALVATIALAFDREPSGLGIGLMIVAIIVGAAIGLQRAKVVEMTGMPELRSEEHTSELQSLMRISYAVFCLKKKTLNTINSCNS